MTYDELEETVRTFGDGADFNGDTDKAEEKTTVALEATEDKKKKQKNKIDKPKAPHGGGGRGGGKKGYIYYTDNQSWHPYNYKGYKGDKGRGIGKGKGKGGYWVKNGGGRGGGRGHGGGGYRAYTAGIEEEAEDGKADESCPLIIIWH
jgi:hypothetical protein